LKRVFVVGSENHLDNHGDRCDHQGREQREPDVVDLDRVLGDRRCDLNHRGVDHQNYPESQQRYEWDRYRSDQWWQHRVQDSNDDCDDERSRESLDADPGQDPCRDHDRSSSRQPVQAQADDAHLRLDGAPRSRLTKDRRVLLACIAHGYSAIVS
jgi:hypothetical protein